MTSDRILAAPAGALRLEVAKALGWQLWQQQRGSDVLQVASGPRDREPWMRSHDWEAQKKRYKALAWGDYSDHFFVGEFPRWGDKLADAWKLLDVFADGWSLTYQDAHVDFNVYGSPIEVAVATTETEGDKDKAVCLAICRAFLLHRGAGE